jgi:hypothetical protein
MSKTEHVVSCPFCNRVYRMMLDRAIVTANKTRASCGRCGNSFELAQRIAVSPPVPISSAQKPAVPAPPPPPKPRKKVHDPRAVSDEPSLDELVQDIARAADHIVKAVAVEEVLPQRAYVEEFADTRPTKRFEAADIGEPPPLPPPPVRTLDADSPTAELPAQQTSPSLSPPAEPEPEPEPEAAPPPTPKTAPALSVPSAGLIKQLSRQPTSPSMAAADYMFPNASSWAMPAFDPPPAVPAPLPPPRRVRTWLDRAEPGLDGLISAEHRAADLLLLLLP